MNLQLSRIGKSYGETRVLSGIDLAIAAGEFIAVLGPSGCGKTTLLRLVAGFDRPDEGTIALGDRVLADGATMVPPKNAASASSFRITRCGRICRWPRTSAMR